MNEQRNYTHAVKFHNSEWEECQSSIFSNILPTSNTGYPGRIKVKSKKILFNFLYGVMIKLTVCQKNNAQLVFPKGIIDST